MAEADDITRHNISHIKWNFQEALNNSQSNQAEVGFFKHNKGESLFLN
jgi:hypothetical protein